MATNSTEYPSDHQDQELEGRKPVGPQNSQPAEDDKKKKKREADKKYLLNKKQKMENSEKETKTLRAQVFRYEGEIEAIKNFCLDPVKELKEITKHEVEKITAIIGKLWEVLEKSQLPGGSISATTDEVAYPPLELSVMAMSLSGLFRTESFKPCQSVPEEWAPLATGPRGRLIKAFYGLKEHYMALTVRHAEEITRLRQDMEVRHAEEIARLTQDLEVCHAEKEKLEQELKEARKATDFLTDIEPLD